MKGVFQKMNLNCNSELLVIILMYTSTVSPEKIVQYSAYVIGFQYIGKINLLMESALIFTV